ncbi:MAG: hypothetical protein HRT87_08490 [Legionellales bacterium]|nr:hypothetical protein [Legionellales bacterium]
MSSTPTVTEFNPNLIPYQFEVINDIRQEYNYNLGVHEIMLSGSVGSAKSLLMAHAVITHCLFNSGAHALIGRKALPQLKDTLFQMIRDHLATDVNYKVNTSRGIIEFENGSKITCFSWADKAYKKVRSYALSCAAIEEFTENADLEFYKEIKMRVGRIPHIKENFIINATNPDAPDHPAHKYFIEKADEIETRHVYYSLTEQNPFLPKTYIENLKETLTPKEADRMLRGKWVSIHTDVVFYNYDKPRNYVNEHYQWNPRLRIDLFFDFNIGYGKPMSAAAGQVDEMGVFHIGKDFIIEGARTEDVCEEIYNSGILHNHRIINIFGDCNGRNRDTRNTLDDYAIIKRYFERKGFRVIINVPKSNPDLRASENLTNAMCLNEQNKVRLKVYKDAYTAHEGLNFTKYKKGAKLIQDDSDYFQHVSTAIRYWIWEVIEKLSKPARPVQIGKYR